MKAFIGVLLTAALFCFIYITLVCWGKRSCWKSANKREREKTSESEVPRDKNKEEVRKEKKEDVYEDVHPKEQ